MMKNKLLASIMAALLVLVASASAFDAGSLTVTPNPLNMAEDGTAAVTISITNGDGTETLNFDFGTDLQNTASTLVRVNNNSWTMDVKPVQDFSGATNLDVTINGVETEILVVNVAEQAPVITAIDDKLAVEDNEFSLQVAATDGDNEALTYELTQKPTGMAISATGLITWTPDKTQFGEHTITVKVTDSKNASATEDFKATVRPKKVCKYGEIGDLDITVDNPDDNDEFKAGDDIEMDIQVDNDGDENLDVTVKAMLYNLDEGKLLATVSSDETRIKDGEEENFDLSLTIPTTDFDVDDDFMLYITACENDDENCAFKAIPVELTRDDDDVIVSEMDLTPEEVAPGKTVTATITVSNIGEDDQDNVYVKLRNSYLDLNQETASFDLDDYKSDDNEYTATVTFTVPEDAEAKEYWVEAIVYFDSGRETDSELAKLVVAGKSSLKAAVETGVSSLEVVPEAGISVEAGKKVAVPVMINNAGNAKASFTVEVSSMDGWAEIVAIEQPEQLNAGESGHAYVYLEIAEDAAIGVHELNLNIRNQDGLLATKKVAVTVEGTTAEQAPAEETNKVTGFFTAGSSAANTFYVTGAVVLVLIGLFFLRMLFKK